MEILLLWWDELDDLVALCRHLLRALIAELSSIGAPLRAHGAVLSVWRQLSAENSVR